MKVSNEEIVCMLGAYLANPEKWTDICEDIRANIGQLNEQTQQLYRTSSIKQLRDRLSSKLS